MEINILLRMKHGLGDNAQFTIVLRHIKHYFPHWSVDMVVGQGKESYFKQYVRNIYRRNADEYDEKKYDLILDVKWPTPRECLHDLPSSKPTRFLKEVLKVEPIERFYRGYDITITEKEHRLADEYVASLPDKPFVILHYLAKTLKHRKSLGHDDAAYICLQILKAGYTPVVLDWKNESPVHDNKHIFNPGADCPLWEGETLSSAGTIAALISRAKLYIGVDSGPLHVAGCTKTPSIGVWHGHHPINFFDLCPNVTHLVSHAGAKKTIKGKKKDKARKYFEKNYNHIYYDSLSHQIECCLRTRLG